MKRFDLLSIGEPLLEFNQTRPGEPTYLQGFGGDSSNAAIAAARQGARVAYYTRLGKDEFGAAFRRLWAEEGVDASAVQEDPAAHTGIYFITHGPEGLDDARVLSGREEEEANLDWAHSLGARNVLLKLGAGGVLVSDGHTSTRLAGMNVRAVDATGAGDCFCGATLARLAAGDDLIAAARYSNAAAALSTTGFGAVAPQPRPDAVRRLLG